MKLIIVLLLSFCGKSGNFRSVDIFHITRGYDFGLLAHLFFDQVFILHGTPVK